MGCDGDPAISYLYGRYARGEITLEQLREIEANDAPSCRHDYTSAPDELATLAQAAVEAGDVCESDTCAQCAPEPKDTQR